MEIEQRLLSMENRLNDLEHKVDQLLGAQNTLTQLIKFVILPLIIIVGGLVGIKIAIP